MMVGAILTGALCTRRPSGCSECAARDRSDDRAERGLLLVRDPSSRRRHHGAGRAAHHRVCDLPARRRHHGVGLRSDDGAVVHRRDAAQRRGRQHPAAGAVADRRAGRDHVRDRVLLPSHRHGPRLARRRYQPTGCKLRRHRSARARPAGVRRVRISRRGCGRGLEPDLVRAGRRRARRGAQGLHRRNPGRAAQQLRADPRRHRAGADRIVLGWLHLVGLHGFDHVRADAAGAGAAPAGPAGHRAAP